MLGGQRKSSSHGGRDLQRTPAIYQKRQLILALQPFKSLLTCNGPYATETEVISCHASGL